MSSSPSVDQHQHPDFPQITQPPSPPKRKRRRTRPPPVRGLTSRQTIFDQEAVQLAKAQCADTGNDVVSCYPTAGISVPQHEEAFFVWNSRRPQLTQTNLVNIYLIRAGSDTPVLSWLDVQNPTTGLAGNIGAVVNDSWFPSGGTGWSGTNISTAYYFVITRADEGLDGGQTPQFTFNAVQTTLADAVASSVASVSAVSTASIASVSRASQTSVASASIASVSSASRSASNSQAAATGGAGNPAGIQDSSNAGFPHWAIAVIVVLGVLAIVALAALTFLILRRLRQREAMAAAQRGSMGSSSPMIPGAAVAAGAPQSPAMEEQRRLYDPPISAAGHTSLNSPNDDASMISHAQSQAQSTGDSGLFSGADAAIMADAFRKVLRKPDFAGRPPIEEGESPDSQTEARADNRLMSWELAEEGRDIRSVGSSRGVKVENASDNDGASTVHDAQ